MGSAQSEASLSTWLPAGSRLPSPCARCHNSVAPGLRAEDPRRPAALQQMGPGVPGVPPAQSHSDQVLRFWVLGLPSRRSPPRTDRSRGCDKGLGTSPVCPPPPVGLTGSWNAPRAVPLPRLPLPASVGSVVPQLYRFNVFLLYLSAATETVPLRHWQSLRGALMVSPCSRVLPATFWK